MAWEVRNRRKYYYRKRREGNRVIFEYLGGGLEAEQYAQACQETEKSIQRERERKREMAATGFAPKV